MVPQVALIMILKTLKSLKTLSQHMKFEIKASTTGHIQHFLFIFSGICGECNTTDDVLSNHEDESCPAGARSPVSQKITSALDNQISCGG